MITNEINDEFKGWVKKHLAQGPVNVIFTKKNGDLREMDCTTNPTFIMFKEPNILEEALPKTTRKINEDVCVVYDLGSNAWRSFRWDSIKHISFKLVP